MIGAGPQELIGNLLGLDPIIIIQILDVMTPGQLQTMLPGLAGPSILWKQRKAEGEPGLLLRQSRLNACQAHRNLGRLHRSAVNNQQLHPSTWNMGQPAEQMVDQFEQPLLSSPMGDNNRNRDLA
ncbi:MAG: hypothetical protein VKL23_02675 [Cyanobacteriota bacterium]|nr:hypothetical protein [Cyanobacteriota bacterium]